MISGAEFRRERLVSMARNTGGPMSKSPAKKSKERGRKRTAQLRPTDPDGLSPAGAKIVSAFREAIDLMGSGKPLPGRFTVRNYPADFIRPDYGPAGVRRVRD